MRKNALIVLSALSLITLAASARAGDPPVSPPVNPSDMHACPPGSVWDGAACAQRAKNDGIVVNELSQGGQGRTLLDWILSRVAGGVPMHGPARR